MHPFLRRLSTLLRIHLQSNHEHYAHLCALADSTLLKSQAHILENSRTESMINPNRADNNRHLAQQELASGIDLLKKALNAAQAINAPTPDTIQTALSALKQIDFMDRNDDTNRHTLQVAKEEALRDLIEPIATYEFDKTSFIVHRYNYWLNKLIPDNG